MKDLKGKLPKSKLFDIEWQKKPLRYARFRLANAVRIHFWRFVIHHRAPWLEHSARQLHPHLFRQGKS